MICSNCGTDNETGLKFCDECGAALTSGCPSCGATNRPTAKFCGECGTRLSPAADAESGQPGPVAVRAAVAERRLVSVLFADLVGFTTLAEGRDAEDTRELLSHYFDLAHDVIARYGGTVEKFIGDAVMAVWGAPVAQEDDAERAVRAALELVDAVRALGPSVQARAGVLTGEAAVTLGAVGQGMVAGDLVNTASRLQSVAAPGTVLVGEATHRAASRAIVFEPAGEQALKGKTAPIPAWRALRVVAERGGRNRSEALEAPFVGRDDELRLLKDLFHATTREQRARLVSVIGPPGIGKTRLAWEFLKYIDGLVETVLWHDGRSPAYGEGITFWSLGEMVRGRAGLLETDDAPTTRLKVSTALATYVPDEDERRFIEPALLALLGIEPSTSGSEQLFAAWRMFFERLAAAAPVVMVFEDFHYADTGLIDFVDHLLEWSRSVPIYVVTLARPELLERRPDWSAGKRNFTSLYLEPLPERAMRALLAGLVPGLPEPAVRAIVARADGVPLYAVETVRMLLADGRLVLDAGAYHPVGDLTNLAVPETLTALIASRLDGLATDDRALASDASVLGQSFSLAALSAVSGIPEVDLEPRLRPLVRRELLILEADPRSPERGQYAFVQALIREVAYNTLAKRDRKTRHLAAARYFEGLGSDELAGALAGHYLAAHGNAAEGAEADALAAQARVALRAATERAVALGSHEQAVALIEQALTVTDDEAERADLLLQAAKSSAAATKNDAGERYFRAAVELYRGRGDEYGAARATAGLGHLLLARGQIEEAIALLEPAIKDLVADPQGPPAAVVMGALARAYRMHNEPARAVEWAERLLPLAERLDLVDEVASGLLSRAGGLDGRPREAQALVRAALELALTHDLVDVEPRARTVWTFIQVTNDPRAGLAEARKGLESARRLGSRQYAMSMIGNGVDCAFRTGDWDWAIATLREWLDEELDPNARIELSTDLARFVACRGEDAAALMAVIEPLRDLVNDRQYEAYRSLSLAWSALAGGDFEATEAAVRQAGRDSSLFDALGLPIAARAAIWSGDVERARAALGDLDGRGRGVAIDTERIAIRAGISALAGDAGDAMGLYRDALRRWRGAGLVWDEALCAIDMATVLDPSEPEVRAAAEAAHEILVRLAAAPFVARLDSALLRSSDPAGRAVPVTGSMSATPS